MLTQNPLQPLLDQKATLVIYGALATLLESRGCDLNHPLWSAKILASNPELVQQVHYDYFIAGSDIAITASYQASLLGPRDAYGYNDKYSIPTDVAAYIECLQTREQFVSYE